MAENGEPADRTQGPTSRHGRSITLTEEGGQYQIDTKEKKYQKCLKELRKVGVSIVTVSKLEETVDDGEDAKLSEVYIQWKRAYVDFIQIESELQVLLPDSERQQHTTRHQGALAEINIMKTKMEAKLEPTHEVAAPPASVSIRSTGSSVRSKISLMRLEEAQKRAEVEAKAAAVKKRLAIERQRQELEWQMQELEVETERDVLEARKEALVKFEQDEGICAPELPVAMNRSEKEETRNQDKQTPPTDCRELQAGTDPSAGDVLTSLVSVLKEQNNRRHLPRMEPDVFSGSVEKFPIWVNSFETYVEHRTKCAVERLHFLSKYTEGEAHSAIAGFLHLRTSEAYAKAKEKLIARYGNDYLVANSYTRRLREWPSIRSGDSKGLQKLADFLEHGLMASTAITGMKALDDPHTIQLVLRKLPVYIADRWKRQVDKTVYGVTPRYPSFAEFVQLLTKEARIACGPVSMQLKDENTPTSTKGTKGASGKAHTFASNTEKTACKECGHRDKEGLLHAATTDRARRPCVICVATTTP